MTPQFVIWARECKSLLRTMSAWCVFAVTASLTGILFPVALRDLGNECEHLPAIICRLLMLVMCVPVTLFSMRLFPEEKTSGTLENLLTAPLSDRQVVLGKFLVSLTMVTLSWASALLVLPVYLLQAAPPPAWSGLSLAGGLFVLFLVTMVWCSAGCLISLISRRQITAGAIIFTITLLSAYAFSGTASDPVRHMIFEIADIPSAARGVADTRILFGTLSLTWFFLFCAVRKLELRDWTENRQQ